MNPHLPVVTGKDLVRTLGKRGWHVCHARGSHCQLKNDEAGKKITIPIHAGKELKRGLLHSILKEVGLSADDLRELL